MTTEERKGKTPNGGVKSVIHYLDDDGQPVEKDVATRCIIEEFDAEGESIMRTYGTLNRE